ncbi:MAG: SMC-Scp complex subunit ScpB [Candidatus Methanoperedens sp.]|nr:SMC-Scp complex subunit ScpB [Candidatus Methanoperedens sp.]
MNEDKAIIEAALFVSGEPLLIGQLSNLVKGKNVHFLIHELIEEYSNRGGSLEIKEIDGKYVMQVKPEFATRVKSMAPKELRSTVLRTLAIIAYHQPLTVANLVNRRGAAAYDHVMELEESGLISAIPQGRTRLLHTTHRFAEYFNLDTTDPMAIKKKIIELAREQKMGLDKWLGKQGIGVSPMYESLMDLCGILDYQVINPYGPEDIDRSRLEELGVLVISKGYQERVGNYFDGRIIEVSAVTFNDLTNSINMLAEYGSKMRIRGSLEYISNLKDEYIEKTYSIRIKTTPQTEMISRMVNELRLGISAEGVNIAPDYGTGSKGEEIGKGADILIPTHKNAELDVVKRICQRYDALIDGLKKISN